MRGEMLKKVLPEHQHTVIDTDLIYNKANRVLRSLAFRYKIGPLVASINKFVIQHLGDQVYDLIWVDKAIYLTPATTAVLKQHARVLLHFTPDPAFVFHSSRHFEHSIKLYDYLVTTKIFELKYYHSIAGKAKTIYCTQGYDPAIHKPYHSFSEKSGVVFIGHHEKDREGILQEILNKGIEVKLAGIDWEPFRAKNRNNPNLAFMGTAVLGEEYAKLISSGLVSLGLLSKYIPEQHTTRTFEIPACGTALLTERTGETTSIFRPDEAFFFDDTKEIGEVLQSVFSDKQKLEEVTGNGYRKVTTGGYDYYSLLDSIVKQIGFH